MDTVYLLMSHHSEAMHGFTISAREVSELAIFFAIRQHLEWHAVSPLPTARVRFARKKKF